MSGSQPKSATPRTKPDRNTDSPSGDGLTQSERFIKAAQELGTDDDPERFKERVKKIAKASQEKAR